MDHMTQYTQKGQVTVNYPPYPPERFNTLIEAQESAEHDLLGIKGAEYGDGVDRLENFHRQAMLQGTTPAQIALTYLLKHILSITKAVTEGKATWTWQTAEGHEGLQQRVTDARNYLLLLACCLEEEYVIAKDAQEPPTQE